MKHEEKDLKINEAGDLSDNEFLEKFMTGDTFDKDGFCNNTERKYSWRPGCYDPFRVEHLDHYKSSWGWLMPVCTKALKKINRFIEKSRTLDEIPMDDWNKAKTFKSTIETTLIGGDIKKLHKRLVQFTKWYLKLEARRVSF